MITLLKQLAIGALVVFGLTMLGGSINEYLPWSWLTQFFALLRAVVRPVDFIWDTESLFKILSYVFSVLIGIWSFKAVLVVRSFLSPKNEN